MVINGDGTQTRDYVHVHDVVRANLAAFDGPAGVYNIGTGVETDVNTLYRMLAAAAGVSAGAEHGPAKPGEQRRSCLDTTRHARCASAGARRSASTTGVRVDCRVLQDRRLAVELRAGPLQVRRTATAQRRAGVSQRLVARVRGCLGQPR